MMGINGIAITISTLISGRLADYFGDTTPFIGSLIVSILGMMVFFVSKENKKKIDKKNQNFFNILIAGEGLFSRVSAAICFIRSS